MFLKVTLYYGSQYLQKLGLSAAESSWSENRKVWQPASACPQ